MIKLYHYDVARNKFDKNGKLPKTLRKELYAENPTCYICNGQFNLGHFQLEHIIPVKVGGHLFAKKNVALVCQRCHLPKTKLDILTINSMKRDKIIFGSFIINSFLPIEEVIKIFIEKRKLISKIQDDYKKWEFGSVDVDYQQIFQKENRI
jgi:hypothetical protein